MVFHEKAASSDNRPKSPPILFLQEATVLWYAAEVSSAYFPLNHMDKSL